MGGSEGRFPIDPLQLSPKAHKEVTAGLGTHSSSQNPLTDHSKHQGHGEGCVAGQHSWPAWGRPLPSRSSFSPFSLTATPLGLQDWSHHDTQTGFGSPDLCGSQRVRVVSRRVSDPGASACPPRFLLWPQEPLCFCPTGTGSQWKQGPRARLGDHAPGWRHPSLAATSCPTPSRMYTDWISLVLRQRSQAQTAEASVVSSP